MYLGSTSMDTASTYYLPLLPVMKKKAETDSSLKNKIESLEKLPKIEILNSENKAGLPQEALTMISHGGYKVMLRTTPSGENILAFRDIPCIEKDENGRSIPFMLLLVGNENEGMDVIASYFISHINLVENQLATMFRYDAQKNGIEFTLGAMNEFVNGILEKPISHILTTKKSLLLSLEPDKSYLVVSKTLPRKTALEEQNLQDKKVEIISQEDLIPLDDKERMASILALLLEEKSLLKQKSSFYIAGSAAIAGFLLGYFLTRN